MQPTIRLLRLLRECEAGLRGIAEDRPQLRHIADEMAAEAQKLKAELIEYGLIQGSA
jgi:hypothetical protein